MLFVRACAFSRAVEKYLDSGFLGYKDVLYIAYHPVYQLVGLFTRVPLAVHLLCSCVLAAAVNAFALPMALLCFRIQIYAFCACACVFSCCESAFRYVFPHVFIWIDTEFPGTVGYGAS